MIARSVAFKDELVDDPDEAGALFDCRRPRRPGETLPLRPAFAHCHKNGRTRELPLSQKALRVMKAHRHLRGDQVFCNPDGSMFTKEQCKHPLWRACKRAGLRRIGWHVMRHTFASHLSPDVRRDAVGLLDKPAVHVHGTIAAQEAN